MLNLDTSQYNNYSFPVLIDFAQNVLENFDFFINMIRLDQVSKVERHSFEKAAIKGGLFFLSEDKVKKMWSLGFFLLLVLQSGKNYLGKSVPL